jgi:hypothetical protein
VNLAAFTNDGVCGDMGVGVDPATFSNSDLIIDNSVGTDHHIGCQLSPGINDCSGMNLGGVLFGCHL